jgi:DNA-binding response OmpR family regulator
LSSSAPAQIKHSNASTVASIIQAMQSVSSSIIKNILVIDDEVDITFTFKIGLENTGLFTVDTLNDPQVAFFRFKPSMYDLLLIDIRMPKMSGYELYKEIRKIDAEIKVIFLTASPFENLQKVFPTFNKNYYILKPVEINELIKKVNSIIATNLHGHL